MLTPKPKIYSVLTQFNFLFYSQKNYN